MNVLVILMNIDLEKWQNSFIKIVIYFIVISLINNFFLKIKNGALLNMSPVDLYML
jgi:hypothetical protein